MKTTILTLLAALAGFSLPIAAAIGFELLHTYINETEYDGSVVSAIGPIGHFTGLLAGAYVFGRLTDSERR